MLSTDEWITVRLSLEVASLATLYCLPFAVAFAWILARLSFPGKAFVDAIVMAPLVLPPTVIGYLLLIVMGTNGPIGGWFLRTFDVRFIFTTKGAIMAAALMALPLVVRSVRLSLDAIDRGLELAARTLGASRPDVFVTVTLPLMLPGILAGCIVGFARGLGEFGATITFASNIPGQTRTLPLAIYTATQTPQGDETALRLVAVSMVMAVAALALAEFLERRLRDWLGREGPP